ncbi:hypothetical protein [Pasteurella testudinis]|uniref:hypothetical protein n=1 Tax=Pasteurella testudinis TaxID=761 RepID=UPI004059C132
MDDITAAWRAVKEYKRTKRAMNKKNNTLLLKTLGVQFVEKNLGGHLIIDFNGRKIDFFPSTGLW